MAIKELNTQKVSIALNTHMDPATIMIMKTIMTINGNKSLKKLIPTVMAKLVWKSLPMEFIGSLKKLRKLMKKRKKNENKSYFI